MQSQQQLQLRLRLRLRLQLLLLSLRVPLPFCKLSLRQLLLLLFYSLFYVSSLAAGSKILFAFAFMTLVTNTVRWQLQRRLISIISADTAISVAVGVAVAAR